MSARLARAVAAVALAGALLLPVGPWGSARADDSATTAPTSALATPVLSARRVPGLLRSSIEGDQIRAAVEPLLADAPPDRCLVISTGGRVVLDDAGTQPLAPASTMKLLTGTAVLDHFGPDARLTTTAAADKKPDDGVIDGPLYLIGGGDPILSTPGYETTFKNTDQLSNDFGQLADAIAAAGVREIRGGVVGDDSRYDTQRWVSTWPERYQREDQVGPLSALIVNDGSTGLSENPDQPAASRQPGDPPSLAAATLISLLEARGVVVDGDASAGQAPASTTVVATLDSPPMSDLVGEMISESDNTTAELLLKELGLSVKGEGTTAAGVAAVLDDLSARGLPLDGVSMPDGSGLDPNGRVTCSLLVDLLDQQGPDSSLTAKLPVAAETGTLRPRMHRTAADGRVRAKSGTLATVNALAGFATPDGATVTFAYLVNGTEQPRGYAPLDDLAVALASLPEGPPLDSLAPLPTG